MGGFLGLCCSIGPWLWGGSALLGSCWFWLCRLLGVPLSCPVPASSDPDPTAPGPLQEQPPQAGCPSGTEGAVFQRGGRGNILPGDAPGGAEGAAGASSAPPGLPTPPAEPSGHRGSPQHPGDIGGWRGGGRGAASAPLAQAAPSGGGLWGPTGPVSAPHGVLGGAAPGTPNPPTPACTSQVPALQVLAGIAEPGAPEPGGQRLPGGGGWPCGRGPWPRAGPLQGTVTGGGHRPRDLPLVSAVGARMPHLGRAGWLGEGCASKQAGCPGSPCRWRAL